MTVTPSLADDALAATTVLVVDDEAPVREILQEILKLDGHHSLACDSGEAALNALRQQPFDLVISDLRMPGISGLELLRQVHDSYPRIGVIMITAVSELQVGLEAMRAGAIDYITKPFNLELVSSSIRRALRIKRLEREVEDYRLHLEGMVRQRTAELETALEQIRQTYDETLRALGSALDIRATEMGGHSLRVSRYCEELGRAMGCEGEELRNLVRGAFLHDIGKLGIPDAILLKQGRLTAQERRVMETHAAVGFELVRRIAFLAPASEIVLYHQERYDGTGYPHGLKGAQIPFGARVFAIADALDAMTSDRHYRAAIPFELAREEIIRESGRQFDPQMVNAFLAIPSEVWPRIQREVREVRDNGNPEHSPVPRTALHALSPVP